MQINLTHLTLIALSVPCFAEGLSLKEANSLTTQLVKERKQVLADERAKDFADKKIVLGDKTLPYAFIEYGKVPSGGHSLYISMHGGGGTRPSVNDQQWKNQIRLYKPDEGYYLAPRAATNTWNLWHEAHIDPMFDRIIENFVAVKGVNPNKVYLTGYSAGGDGTYQLAPRMADRWAAAAMMAGHPNDAQPDNLYNLPFFIQCGGKDTPYKRNAIAAEWGKKLEKLAKDFPGAYENKTIIYPELGHWMDGKDKVAIPWMAKFERNPWPKHIVWLQDDVTVDRFYWLSNPAPAKGQRITADVQGQTITLDTTNVPSITLRLNDKLVDLDKEITVQRKSDSKVLFKGKVERSKAAIEQSLKQRFDPTSVASATLEVTL